VKEAIRKLTPGAFSPKQQSAGTLAQPLQSSFVFFILAILALNPENQSSAGSGIITSRLKVHQAGENTTPFLAFR
jgi:hypothetical protein